jgi:hypothetical protein
MLPPSQRKCYQEFQQALEQLRSTATVPDFEVAALRDDFQDVQQLFQSQIANLSADDLAPSYSSRWQSFQTEIYKQMRLLETDLMLLQASRSAATSLSRTSSVSDRIKTLIQYCEALLQL